MREIIEGFRRREVTLETVLNKLSESGDCPNLLNDDNGHWALVFDGIQSVPEEDISDMWTCFHVGKEYWKDSIYEAVLYSLEKDDEDIFKTAEVKELLNKYLKEEISFSRFVEMLNELANKKLRLKEV